MISLMKDNVLGRKSIYLNNVNNRCFAVVLFKHTCVCSEITFQEAILPAGQDSYENGILDTGQMAYQAT